MTFVNYDVAKIVLRVMASEKGCVGVIGIHIECLVGCDKHPRILLRLATRNRRGISTENILKGSRRLGAQLIPVANEKGSAQLSGISNSPQKVHRYIGLAGTSRQ